MVITFEFNAKVKIPDADQKVTVDELENVLKEILENELGGKAEVHVHYLEEGVV